VPKIKAKHSVVKDYWLEYYCDKLCTLCGNTRLIDTRDIKTLTGLEVRRINYCICPNGQNYRKIVKRIN
jgi:hypothetical protein